MVTIVLCTLLITGTLYVGQVNLYLLPPLALAWRGVLRSGSLALVTAVKLYPLAALPAFLARGRRGLRPLLTALAATAALTVLPNLLAGSWAYGTDVVQMFEPDPYWSNCGSRPITRGRWRTCSCN